MTARQSALYSREARVEDAILGEIKRQDGFVMDIRPVASAAIRALTTKQQHSTVPKTAGEVKAICRAWLDADDASHWGVFEKALDAVISGQPQAPSGDLREALERISALTPERANADTAFDLHCTVKAIADSALAIPTPEAEAGRLDVLEAHFAGFKSGEREGFFAGYNKGHTDTERNPATAWKEHRPTAALSATAPQQTEAGVRRALEAIRDHEITGKPTADPTALSARYAAAVGDMRAIAAATLAQAPAPDARAFEEWLNDQRDATVGERFHEIVARFSSHRAPDADLGQIGPGHVCKHGVRWPHACQPCDDAAWDARSAPDATVHPLAEMTRLDEELEAENPGWMTGDATMREKVARPSFEREERYIVIKRKHLTAIQETSLRAHMARLAIGTVECVVIESDWPEYETVWRMIEDRVAGAHPQPIDAGFNAGIEAAAAVANKWSAENRASAARSRKSVSEGARNMAEMLDGAAIECNAIEQEIRKLRTPDETTRSDVEQGQ